MDEKLFEFKRQLKRLKEYRGSGTELISVYIPAGSPMHDTATKLRQEMSQASNIKSKSTRTNVTGALEKILQHFKLYRQTPERGISIFAGNISDNPAKVDIELFALEPPQPLSIGTYRCDSQFFLEPLERMVEAQDEYGIVVLDGRDATLAVVKGTYMQTLKHLHSTAHQKVSKGGQCLAPDTLVQKSNGEICGIGELKTGDSVRSIDLEAHRMVDSHCADIFRTSGRAYHVIKTHAPATEIKATPFHRFLVLGEFGLQEKYAQHLMVGDQILAARKIHHTGSLIKTGFSAATRVVLTDKEIKKLRKKRNQLGLYQKEIGAKIGVSQTVIERLEQGIIQLSKEKIMRLYEVYGIQFDKNLLKENYRMPVYFDKDLAYLLGVICGDGTVDGNRIIIYEGKRELVEEYCRKIKKVFNLEAAVNNVDKIGKRGSFAKKIYYEIRLYNLGITNALSSLMPEIFARSEKRKIPISIHQSPPPVIAGFLKGIFDAEGYNNGKRVDIASTSKRLIEEIRFLLLYFGIVASFAQKKVKGNPQWYLTITDKVSLINFKKYVGFRRSDKAKHLAKICRKGKLSQQYVDQIPLHGRYVYRLIKELGLRSRDFRCPDFFTGKKGMGRNVFNRNILSRLRKQSDRKAQNVYRHLNKIYGGDAILANVVKNTRIAEKGDFYDLTIPETANFLANGLLVHNSQRRFQRLVEEQIEYFYKRVGHAMDECFLPRNVKGVVIGGPGPTKHNLVKAKTFNYQFNVLGVVDTGYTDEYGLREVLSKSEELLAEQEAVVEKTLVERFIKEVVTNGLATYGERQVREAIQNAQADKVLISEGLVHRWARYACTCGAVAEKVFRDAPSPTLRCEQCKSEMKLQEEKSLVDALIDLAKQHGIEVSLVSTDTTEGTQFLQGFTGTGAFLRYKK